jgi:hypothetical protein
LRDPTHSSTLQTFEEDTSDSENEELDEVSCKIAQLTLENNQRIVRQLLQNEIYFKAAEYQRGGIKRRKRLDDRIARQGEQNRSAGYTEKLIGMKEMLSDILIGCDTAQTDDEAEEVLEELLDLGSERLRTDDTDREWRLNHKLGSL